MTTLRGMLFAVFNLEKPELLASPQRYGSPASAAVPLELAFWWLPCQEAPPSFCTDHLGTRSESSRYFSLLGVPPANLLETFSHLVALVSNCLSCLLHSVRTLSALPGRDSDLNELAHTEPSPFS